MARQGQRVNRQQLAAFYGVSLPTVDSWLRAGMPYAEKGARGVEWAFDTAQVAAWREERAAEEASGTTVQDEAALKRRRALAGVLLDELELAKARGLVAPVDQMQRVVGRLFAEVRTNLRNIPSRVAPQLVGEDDERTVKRVLLEAIDDVLQELADFDLSRVEDDAASDEEDEDA